MLMKDIIFLGIPTLDFCISTIQITIKSKEVNHMTNLGLELLILTVLLIYFGVFITQSIYRKYEKVYLRKTFFCSKSQRAPYCIIE